MKDAEKIIKALKVFDGHAILYDSNSSETVTFQDIVDYITDQKAEIERLTEENSRLNKKIYDFGMEIELNINQITSLERENKQLQKQVDELTVKVKSFEITDLCKEAYIEQLKEEKQQAVKDTAKEIFLWLDDKDKRGMTVPFNMVLRQLKERYGLEVE